GRLYLEFRSGWDMWLTRHSGAWYSALMGLGCLDPNQPASAVPEPAPRTAPITISLAILIFPSSTRVSTWERRFYLRILALPEAAGKSWARRRRNPSSTTSGPLSGQSQRGRR